MMEQSGHQNGFSSPTSIMSGSDPTVARAARLTTQSRFDQRDIAQAAIRQRLQIKPGYALAAADHMNRALGAPVPC
jgi:hypothetical protein